MSIPKIIDVRLLDGFNIFLQFEDGITGEVNLSHLAGKGIFAFWNSYENFKKITIDNGRRLAWSEEIDLDVDSLYMQITGKRPEELFPKLKEDAYAGD